MTTKADTQVKWFHSGMADAPVLSGQAGALINLLDACLINGFSTRTPDSISVSAGVATVNISAGNPYERYAVIVISGASNAALNAEWRIDSAVASSFTFLCPGVADGAVTGASIKRAGGGWVKPFSDTNIAVYQSTETTATQLFLQVKDTDARYTQARGYENMTAATTGTNEFPRLTDVAEGLSTWPKSNLTGTSPRPWVCVTDGYMFYLLSRWHGTQAGSPSIFRFGDLVPTDPLDRYHCILTTFIGAAPSSSPESGGTGVSPNITRYLGIGGGNTVARAAGQIGGPVTTARSISHVGENAQLSGPGPILFTEMWERDNGTNRSANMGTSFLRGLSPGLRIAINNNAETAGPDFELVDLPGGGALLLTLGNPALDSGSNTQKRIAFDITGPWR